MKRRNRVNEYTRINQIDENQFMRPVFTPAFHPSLTRTPSPLPENFRNNSGLSGILPLEDRRLDFMQPNLGIPGPHRWIGKYVGELFYTSMGVDFPSLIPQFLKSNHQQVHINPNDEDHFYTHKHYLTNLTVFSSSEPPSPCI